MTAERNSLYWIIGLSIVTAILFYIAFKEDASAATNNWKYPTPTASPTPTLVLPCIPHYESENVLIPCKTPTPTPTITPSCQPTPTSKLSITPTVIPSETVTPTPTVTPSVAPQAPSNSGNGQGVSTTSTNTTQAPGNPTCTIPFAVPVLTSIVAGQSGQLTVNWLDSGTSINKFSITYGFVGQSLNMGADNIPSSSRSFTISDLPVGSYINAQVQAWQNGCEESSNILDPQVK